jgi:hypothetical protein
VLCALSFGRPPSATAGWRRRSRRDRRRLCRLAQADDDLVCDLEYPLFAAPDIRSLPHRCVGFGSGKSSPRVIQAEAGTYQAVKSSGDADAPVSRNLAVALGRDHRRSDLGLGADA